MREGKPRPKAEGEPHTNKAMTARSEGMHAVRSTSMQPSIIIIIIIQNQESNLENNLKNKTQE